MIAERMIGVACVAIGLMLYYLGADKEATDAYVFPNICAIVMGVLGAIMVFTANAAPWPSGMSPTRATVANSDMSMGPWK